MQNHWINNLDLSDENGVQAILLAQGLNAKTLLEKTHLQKLRPYMKKIQPKLSSYQFLDHPPTS
jgi:hypothetical protein